MNATRMPVEVLPVCRRPRPRATPAIAAAITLGLAAAGCATNRDGIAATSASNTHRAAITLDGSLDDWSPGLVAVADAHYLYFRFSIEGERFAIQNADKSLALWLDADNDAATGARPAFGAAAPGGAPAIDGMGIDLRVQWSTPQVAGGKGRGVHLTALTTQSSPAGPVVVQTPIDRDAADFSSTPTYAAAWYEARLARVMPPGSLPTGFPARGLKGSGQARGVIVMSDAQGRVTGWSQPFTVDLIAARSRPPAEAAIPAAAPDEIRIVSYNILRGGPEKRPEPMGRVISALQPQIVLFQEWDDASAETIAAWMARHVGGQWHAVSAPQHGVAVVSRFPLREAPLNVSGVPGGPQNREQATRAVAAVAQTPAGEVALVSVHLKCCGGAGGWEDQVRTEQARRINAALVAAAPYVPRRVIAGDFNLVGTRPPLDVMRAGLDADGSELDVANPAVLGDAAMYTWTEPGNDFGPGRLDFIVFSDSLLTPVREFVLDARRLGPAALSRAGLAATDTDASDHLPVVLDVRTR